MTQLRINSDDSSAFEQNKTKKTPITPTALTVYKDVVKTAKINAKSKQLKKRLDNCTTMKPKSTKAENLNRNPFSQVNFSLLAGKETAYFTYRNSDINFFYLYIWIGDTHYSEGQSTG